MTYNKDEAARLVAETREWFKIGMQQYEEM